MNIKNNLILALDVTNKDKALEINTSGLRQKLKRTLPDESIVMRYKELGGKMNLMQILSAIIKLLILMLPIPKSAI